MTPYFSPSSFRSSGTGSKSSTARTVSPSTHSQPGAHGSVWGAANLTRNWLWSCTRVLSVEKNLDAGRALWARIWPVCQVLDSTNYASAVKTACDLLGIPVGPTGAGTGSPARRPGP